MRTFYQNLSDREKLDMSSLLNDLGSQRHTVKFISFNYTNALDELIKKIKEEEKEWKSITLVPWIIPSKVYHIHGTNNEYPIIGLNDELQIANEKFRESEEIIDTLVKSKSIDVIRKNWYIDAEREILNSTIVCIFGMSLGNSDKLWWELILNWLSKSSVRQLFLFMYDKEELSHISPRAYRNFQKKAEEQILQFAQDLDISKIRNQIHIIRNTKTLFNFDGLTK